MMTPTKKALTMIGSAHGQLAAAARQRYAEVGRGVMQFSVPELPTGFKGTRYIETHMDYHTRDEIAELTKNLEGDSGEAAAVLLRMMDTYDPATQMVVAVRTTELDFTVKMRLDQPVVVDEAPGVH